MSLISFAADTFATGGRGSPNGISPGSDSHSWTKIAGSQTESFVSSQGLLTYFNNTDLAVWTYGSISQTDQEVAVNITQGLNDGEVAGAVLRCSDANHYYYANIGHSVGNIEIAKVVGGTITSLQLAAYTSAHGTKYRMRFQAIGSTLKVRVWDAATTEPTTWNIAITDTDLFSGQFGICAAPGGFSSIYFDNFAATNGDNPPVNPVPEPSQTGAEQTGLIAAATNADLVPARDISAYEMWSVQIGTIATGGTITFKGSNDGVVFNPILAYNAGTSGAPSTTTTTTGTFYAPRITRYLLIRQTAWISGTTTGTLELYAQAPGGLTVGGTLTTNAGTGTFNNQQSNVTADYDSGAGTQNLTMFGVALPASGGSVPGGTPTNPIRTDPTGTTTQPVSTTSLPLPSGASTSAKQPALGTAGTAAADVLSVQGIAGMTPVLANPSTPYPSGSVPITGASGNTSNADAVATLAKTSGKTTYITGFEVTGAGATVGLPVIVTVAGVVTGTLSYIYTAMGGILLGNTPLAISFNPPIPSSATNADIVVTCPALGAGNTNNSVVAHGYLL